MGEGFGSTMILSESSDGRDSASAPPQVSLQEMSTNPTDEELMQACGRGDLQAFEQIVLRHQESAWNLAGRFLGSSEEARDIVQKAFLKILEAAPRYQPTAAFSTYLYCVLGRLCLDYNRKRRDFLDAATLELPSRNLSPAGTLLAEERDRAVRSALQGLPPKQRMALVLKYYDQLSYQEIATVINVSKKAVERLLARGRETLEQALSTWLNE